MNDDDPLDSIDIDLSTQSLLLASANHDLDAVRELLKTTSATVQDADTGFTPLHAVIAACEQEQVNELRIDETTARKEELTRAAETVRLLLQNGAIWNDLDANDETPGCIARRLGLDELYELVVDAGVRAELLLSKLDEYQPLNDNDDYDAVISQEEDQQADVAQTGATQTDGAVQTDPQSNDLVSVDPSATNAAYLRDRVVFADRSILDSATNGVMMSWEKPIMERHASLLLPCSGLRVLNVGHGMGIIDDFFQSHLPSTHHIIEAHPDVLTKMKDQGWTETPGVVIHEGRWQDILPKLIMGGKDGSEVLFDAIYFDTFAEDYKALQEFFSEWVVQLLDTDGRFAFFNGMGADRQVCYDVYNKVVEIDLFEAGLDVEWEDTPVPDLSGNGEWDGVRRPYWSLKTYRLPTCKFLA